MRDFTWLIQDIIGGTSCPGGGSPGDIRCLVEDLEALKQLGIRSLVCLTERPTHLVRAQKMGFEILHLPISDFQPPKRHQVLAFLRFADSQIEQSKPIAVHCQAGLGRTGTMLAAFLMARGHGEEESISKVRAVRPGSVETREQESALEDLKELLGQKVKGGPKSPP